MCAYFYLEEYTSPALNPCAVISIISSTKCHHAVANRGTASTYSPRSKPTLGHSAVTSASGSYSSSVNEKSLWSTRIDACKLRIRLSILAPHRTGKRCIAFERAGLAMREMNSVADPMSSGVGGPFFARTSCICRTQPQKWSGLWR